MLSGFNVKYSTFKLNIGFSSIVILHRHFLYVFVVHFQFQYSQVICYLSIIVVSFHEYAGRSKL